MPKPALSRARMSALLLAVLATAAVRHARGEASPAPSASWPEVETITILATSVLDTTAGEEFLVRFHSGPSGVVQVVYNEAAQFAIEADLEGPLHYDTYQRHAPPFAIHYLLLADEHQEYGVGNGLNQLHVWGRPFYGHFRYLEHAGCRLRAALMEDWPASLYQISGPRGPADTEGQPLIYRVEERATGQDVLEVRVWLSAVEGMPEHIEYHKDGLLEKAVTNTGFRPVGNGLYFPSHIEVEHHFPEVRQESHEIRQVILNPPLDPALFESIDIHPDARIFRHHLVDDHDATAEDVLRRLAWPRLPAPLTLEEKRASFVAPPPVAVAVEEAEQAVPMDRSAVIPLGQAPEAGPQRREWFLFLALVAAAAVAGIQLHGRWGKRQD